MRRGRGMSRLPGTFCPRASSSSRWALAGPSRRSALAALGRSTADMNDSVYHPWFRSMVAIRANRLALWIAGFSIGIASLHRGSASAQVLHERVALGTLQCQNGLCRADGDSSTRAFISDGNVVYAPEQSAQASAGEQLFTPRPD